MEATDTPKLAEKPLGYGPLSALLVTTGAYFSSELLAGVFLSTLPLLLGWSKNDLQVWLDTSIFAQFLTIVLIAGGMLGFVLWFLGGRKVSWARLGLVKPRLRDVKYGVLGYVAYFVLFVVLSQIAAGIIPGLNLEQEQEVMFDKGTGGIALVFVFLSLVVLPAVVEEIVFRGFLYSGLRSKWPFPVAAIVTSIIFAVAHLQIGSGNPLLWVAALDTLILSMVLVYIREKTGSLAGTMAVHFIKNSLAFTFLFLLSVH